eukprot:3004860-Pyramimonas_sp.AAC.1
MGAAALAGTRSKSGSVERLDITRLRRSGRLGAGMDARRGGVEWSGVEWSGVEWSGVERGERSGVEQNGVEWSGVEWSGA